MRFAFLLKEKNMGAIKKSDLTPEIIGPGRSRYLAHTDNLMIVMIEMNDGPTSEPDPPHAHPHEQVACVVSGEVLFFMDGKSTRLGPGDLYTVPPNVPHTYTTTFETGTDHRRLYPHTKRFSEAG